MKIVMISDTHNQHRALTLPEGDILIHAGDATMIGTHDELESFITWFAEQPHKYKVFVPGNHDWGLEDDLGVYSKFFTRRGLSHKMEHLDHVRESIKLHMRNNNIIYLNNESVTIEGINIYGSADQPAFHSWAFNRTNKELTDSWKNTPDNTNVLVTHAPAYGILDRCEDGSIVGDVALLKRINTLPQLKLHVFGHIHEDAGKIKRGEVVHINASMLDSDYKVNKLSNPVRVFNYKTGE
jgi:Icc-related predicted phosphoesterase